MQSVRCRCAVLLITVACCLGSGCQLWQPKKPKSGEASPSPLRFSPGDTMPTGLSSRAREIERNLNVK